MDQAFFRSVNDHRGYTDEDSYTVTAWRTRLRERLFKLHGARSVLTQIPLTRGFDMHEGLYSRAHVSPSAWGVLLFSGPNCFILRPEEHRVELNRHNPPNRIICYWLAVSFYGKQEVDRWIKSLPFRSTDMPWSGTRGIDMISSIPDKWEVDGSWHNWYLRVESKIDFVG